MEFRVGLGLWSSKIREVPGFSKRARFRGSGWKGVESPFSSVAPGDTAIIPLQRQMARAEQWAQMGPIILSDLSPTRPREAGASSISQVRETEVPRNSISPYEICPSSW